MLHLDLSAAIVGGLVVGLPVALFGLGLSKVIAQRTPVALPAVTARVVTSAGQPARPSLGWSLLQVVTPLIMIAGVTFATTAGWVSPQAKPLVDLVGNKNIALLVALVLALVLVVRQGTGRWGEVRELMTSALEISGPIVLITSAGGAFGAMIQRAGVGKSVELLTAGTGLDPVLLAWFVAAVVRVAQG
jgi:gluconate:H+ symporter, GntP family